MPSASSAPTLPFLERLLDGEKVEWKTLGEICLVQRGASPRPIANYLTNSPNGVPWIKIGDTKIGSKYIESTQERITVEGAQRSRRLSAGDFVLSNSMSYGRPYILKIDGAIHDGWASLSEIYSSILPDYLFYFLSSSKVQMYWEGKINSGSVSNLNADIIKALPIPIPPLRVQSRIVEILDKFTQLEAELEAELEARNKQYDFYRNRLLDFAHRDDLAGQVEWKTLGEVFNTRNGYTPSKTNDDFWKDGTIPWFRMDDIRANGRILYDSALHITPQAVKRNGLFKANSIILATSATIGEHALLQQDALTNQRFTNFEIKEELQELLLPKFAFYYFFIIDEWCKKHTIIGNFPSVDTQQLMEQPFPLPPLSEQHRIVEILDRFDTLTNSISEGLPREITLRRKQYEYYRDALLRFPQPAPTA